MLCNEPTQFDVTLSAYTVDWSFAHFLGGGAKVLDTFEGMWVGVGMLKKLTIYQLCVLYSFFGGGCGVQKYCLENSHGNVCLHKAQ